MCSRPVPCARGRAASAQRLQVEPRRLATCVNPDARLARCAQGRKPPREMRLASVLKQGRGQRQRRNTTDELLSLSGRNRVRISCGSGCLPALRRRDVRGAPERTVRDTGRWPGRNTQVCPAVLPVCPVSRCSGSTTHVGAPCAAAGRAWQVRMEVVGKAQAERRAAESRRGGGGGGTLSHPSAPSVAVLW
jgi:hypothetical protein